ncbi:carotenoid oxygenase family protein [Arundinibacter roseus]|uniref:Lignostilbene-alpha,beta-dioxygenase n=1 Tax=Arundinibacter roseus TaxID=2070510 RepID=A0A4R4KEC7_9BACT|nr:carotenoid oxygenase family protein [Arundinibacter roseus]TDB65086.1 hypothetical protein EZE20_10230 [Arundinibacter roseus]
MSTPISEPLLLTSAQEIEGNLVLLSGSFPTDLPGSVYVVYQVGSVNSEGLPYPALLPDGRPNPEYGSAIMSGDGMVMKLDFGSTPTIRTLLMKTPCYYADFATRNGTAESHADWGMLRFHNFGISRMSLMLGARNPLNTSVTPAQFGTDPAVLIAAYDVGRPYILDPVSLDLKTVIGQNSEWITGTPAKVPWPFELIESTAHPCFDPHTQELFTVNYSHIQPSSVLHDRTLHHLQHSRETFREKLLDLMHTHQHNSDQEAVRQRVVSFFENLDEELSGEVSANSTNIFTRIIQWFKNLFHKKEPETASGAVVKLMRFDGKNPWQQWTLHDQFGQELLIKNCMHQTGLTQDYIILQDSSFKFSTELLFTNPFPEHLELERFLRKALATTMLPYTECYVVKRSELKPENATATAYKLDKPLPIETIHFSCDYENPGGEITLYGIHNAAMCVAEWVRPYDISAITRQPIDPDVLSLFALGTMDVSRIGKWKIDAANFILQEEKSTLLAETGNTNAADGQLGFNTWTVGLYAFRDMISEKTAVKKIDHLWFVSGGLDPKMLTQFIEDLYKDYPNRDVPYVQVKELTKKGLPFSLNYLQTDSMSSHATGYYQFKENDYLRSIQFVPRQAPTPGLDPGLDGYLVCSMQVAYPQPDGSLHRQGEFWIFRAENIAAGPICTCYHPDVKFCFTLHSAWMNDPQSVTMSYNVDVRQDYEEIINQLPDKKIIEPFFEKYVYPYF